MLSQSFSPLAAAARLGGRRGRVLLHSGRDDDGIGAWSFVAAEPTATLIARGRSLVRLDHSGRPARRFTADPLDAAEAFLAEHGCALGARADGPPEPRVIGYFGYDLARVIEQLPGGPSLGQDVPDLWLAAYGAVARWRDGEAVEVIGGDRARLATLLDQGATTPGLPPRLGALEADDDGSHHMARVDKIRDHLAAGDVHQVNLARRLVARIAAPGDALALYAALAEVAPAPYGALVEADGVTVISGSPERYLSTLGDRIETRPIEVAAKDDAEHLRIVDHERNDLGRIAEAGSVRVDRLGYVVELPALYHKASRVSAKPRAGVGYAALLRAMFPGGSITGAPKVRAMQLIDELEPARRGPYCGALGYFGARGACDLAIAIRIGVIKGSELRVHVGRRIVADSDPAAELAETADKAAGWVAALARLARS